MDMCAPLDQVSSTIRIRCCIRTSLLADLYLSLLVIGERSPASKFYFNRVIIYYANYRFERWLYHIYAKDNTLIIIGNTPIFCSGDLRLSSLLPTLLEGFYHHYLKCFNLCFIIIIIIMISILDQSFPYSSALKTGRQALLPFAVA